MIQKPQQVTLEQKIKNCRQVVIQNMEKTIQHKMVYLYFSNKKIDADIKTFSVNSKDGIIKIQFHDAEKARNFYESCNFKERILLRPFNIYFNLQLSETQMKKYYIQGITQENQRDIFQIANKIGIFKLYTNYTHPTVSRKIKNKAVLSFIRKQQLSEADLQYLTEQLKKKQIKIFPYISDKGLRCSINVYNFFSGDVTQDQNTIATQAEEQIRKIVKPITKDALSNVTINVKRREEKTYVTALLQYADNDQAMNNFELLRDAFVDRAQTKAVLFFHNHESNSYYSLYTSGLLKQDKQMSEKRFQKQLLQKFKKVNPGVIQVNVYHVKTPDSYIGRIYLRSQEQGKHFIVNYVTKREEIHKFYQDSNRINFNINVDNKTMKKIKQAERKATQIAKNIKNSQQAHKKSKRQNPASNQMPISFPGIPMGFGPNMSNMANMPNMGQIGGPMGFMPPNPMMGGKGITPMAPGMSPMMGINPNIPPPMGSNVPMMGMGAMGIQTSPKIKFQQTLRDKQLFLKMQAHTAKRIIAPVVKYVLQINNAPKQQINILSQKILKEDLKQIYRYLENFEQLKGRLTKQNIKI